MYFTSNYYYVNNVDKESGKAQQTPGLEPTRLMMNVRTSPLTAANTVKERL